MNWFNESAIQNLSGYAVNLCKNLLAAVVIYIIGKWLIRKVNSIVSKLMRKKHVEASLHTFLESIVNVSLWILLVIAVISVLGVETSSFVALFTGAGMAIGMAMSGRHGFSIPSNISVTPASGLDAYAAMAFAPSREEPPPIAMMKSQPSSLANRPPA